MQWQLLRLGQVPAVTQGQVHLFTVLNWGLLIGDAVVGLLILRARWQRTSPGRQDPTVPDRPQRTADIAPASAEAKRQ